MRKSKLRGHDIEYINDEWVYSDTKHPTVNNERKCGYCGKERTIEGHDGCLGELIGVTNACCGHGRISAAYVQFFDGTGVYGEDAIQIQKILKKYSTNYNALNETREERFKFLQGSVKFYKEEWNL